MSKRNIHTQTEAHIIIQGVQELDDDDAPEQERNPPDDILQRTLVPRPSVVDAPGTSDIQQQSDQASPATARKIQNNMDRDLFWSIINHNPRTNHIPHSSRPMISDTPGASVRATNLNTHVTSRSRSDVRLPDHRTASSRRLERRLHSIDMLGVTGVKHHGQHNVPRSRPYAGPSNASNTSRTTPRGPDPPDRSPSVSPPNFHSTCDNPYDGTQIQRYVQQLIHSNSNSNSNGNNRDANAPWRPPSNYPTSEVVRAMALRRIQPNVVFIDSPRSEEPANPCRNDGPNSSQPPANPCRLDGPSNSQAPANPCRPDGPSTSQAPAEPYRRYVRDGYSNVVEQSVQDVNVSQAPNQNVEQLDQVNGNIVAETDEEIRPPESGSVGMIEEVFELGAPNLTETNLPPQSTKNSEQGNTVTPAENNGNTGAVNSDESLESPQQGSSYGVKRKRDANDESGENYTIQEFNQSLLRLLECPVCLEWIEPPMSQCRRGHLVCSRCRARLANCPVCRTPFSSVRNRAMEGVAEMVRYPCRHGCGREVRLRRRGAHEASCAARRYLCPAPACARQPPLPRHELPLHFQSKHLSLLKIGCKHKFSMKVNSEQHDTWLIMALDECFHLRVDVDIRTWGVIVYVAYLGPKKNASSYKYEVTVLGQRNSRKLTYSRSTHSDLESSSVNVSRQDCFHLTLDQALNFLRVNNRHCEPDKFLDFDVEITKWESVGDNRDDSES